MFLPYPAAPGGPRVLSAGPDGRPVAHGPTVELRHASASAHRAIATQLLAAAGTLPGDPPAGLAPGGSDP